MRVTLLIVPCVAAPKQQLWAAAVRLSCLGAAVGTGQQWSPESRGCAGADPGVRVHVSISVTNRC